VLQIVLLIGQASCGDDSIGRRCSDDGPDRQAGGTWSARRGGYTISQYGVGASIARSSTSRASENRPTNPKFVSFGISRRAPPISHSG
jgi:hypothetical protein